MNVNGESQTRFSSHPDSGVEVSAQLHCLLSPFSEMSVAELLIYLQKRTHVRYFSLSSGSVKYVVRAEKILQNEFNFNHETYQLPEHFNWLDNPSRDIEWLILLHKFYYGKDLARAYAYTHDEKYALKWVNLVSAWIAQTPAGFIDSQVTGRRLQQWLLAYQYFVVKHCSIMITPEFIAAFIASIASQTKYLRENLTPEGNHRTIELYAVYLVAVMFPELRLADTYLNFAREELLKNIRQDFLQDGVQRELSTDYHHIVLKNHLRVRSLASLNGIQLASEYDAIICKALEFSIYVHKPDGFIPAINDADCNSYLPLLKKACCHYPSEQARFVVSKGKQGKPPKKRSRGFTDSGYYILRENWSQQSFSEGFYLFFDCGPIGFGSHGHYDVLSFEAAAHGHSLIVDPGRYSYTDHHADGFNWRSLYKSTAYHNTVVVDAKDQVISLDKETTLAGPTSQLKKFVSSPGFDLLHAQTLSPQYNVLHERIIYFAIPEYWLLIDLLHGNGEHCYDMYLHLTARAQNRTTLHEASDTIIRAPNLIIAQPGSSNINTVIDTGFVSPEYGIKKKAPIVKFSQTVSGTASFHTLIYPFKINPPGIHIQELPVYKDGNICPVSSASALRINFQQGDIKYTDYFFIAHGSEIKQDFSFSDFNCNGHLLFLRQNILGKIINLQGLALSHLSQGPSEILKELHGSASVCYQQQCLELSSTDGNKKIQLNGLDVFPDWDYLERFWERP